MSISSHAIGETQPSPGPSNGSITGRKPPQAVGRSRWLVLAVILSAVFMQLLDTTITMVAVPSIQTDLRTSYGQVQLVVAGYMLAFACVLVIGGRLGDTYGRKRLFLWGMLGFTAASALCGLAPGPVTLIVARVVQGMFSGLMFPQVLGIIQVIFPQAQRPKALACYGATIGLATILGPVTGGGLIDLDIAGSGWRSIFYINLPIGLIALLLGLLKIPESKADKTGRIDALGALLLAAGLFLLVLPLVIGRDHDWPAWSFASMALSTLVLAAFFRHERGRTGRADSPLINTTLFRQRPFTLGILACLVFFSGIPSFFMVLLMTLQGGFGYSPVKAGAVTLGFALALAIGSVRSSQIARKLGTRVLVVGCGLITAGQLSVLAVLHWTDTDLKAWQLLIPLFIAGAGGGLFLAPVTAVVLAGIRSDDAGSASGVLATAQQVGAAIGIAVVGVLFFGLLGSNASDATSRATPELYTSMASAGVPAAARTQIIDGFTVCFSDRAHSKDPSAEPASCAAIRKNVADSAAPVAVKQKIMQAVQGNAVPSALRTDFDHTLRTVLWWQVGVFALTLLLVSRLPRVRLDGEGPLVSGA
jgi:EmrB/QacA subfamily drug resistance transporter